MGSYLVVERPTGPVEDKEDHIFGPFPAPVVAQLWIEKRKKDLKAVAEITNTVAFSQAHPRMYFIYPMYEPDWN